MEKFEYKTMSVDSKETDKPDSLLTDRLNQYGKDGWELAASFACPCIGSSQYSLIGLAQKTSFIFKRRLLSEKGRTNDICG